MTDTSEKAVERRAKARMEIHGAEDPDARLLLALRSQLTAADQRAEMMADSLAKTKGVLDLMDEEAAQDHAPEHRPGIVLWVVGMAAVMLVFLAFH